VLILMTELCFTIIYCETVFCLVITVWTFYFFREVPHPVTFYSYIFCFHGIMAGPLAFYSEYQEFIDGTNYDKPNPSNVSNVSLKS
jgi:hypothetical protein